MRKIAIYLDDVRTPLASGWTVVRNYDQFVEVVTKTGLENIDMISLDHDLGESAMEEYFKNVAPNFTLNYDNIKEKTGLDCAKFLVKLSLDTETPLPSKIYTHSANPIGSANIMGYINNYYKNKHSKSKCIYLCPAFEIN